MLPSNNKTNWLKKTTAVFAVIFVVVFLFLAFYYSSAQVLTGGDTQTDMYGLQPVQDNIALASTDIRLIIARIIRAVLGLLGIVAISIIIYAGYTIMTSGGNEEKVEKGKKTLINAFIGLAIILSAFSIVQFVINALSDNGSLGNGGSGKPAVIQNFSGSGALGKIVKDHYPERGQTGVKRNVPIFITFSEAMDPSSMIANTNNTCWGDDRRPVLCEGDFDEPYYGDCIVDEDGIDLATDCDQLLTNRVSIYMSEDKTKTPVAAAALTTYDADREAYTFVFRPLTPLGDDLQDIWYTVYLNNNIKRKTGVGAFDNQYDKYYFWDFQTDTEFDFTPPYVVSVDPAEGEKIVKNTIIQINFSEAMDPTSVQGVLDDNGLFTNIIFNKKTVYGEWQLSNGYKTLEFVPADECGVNSCGDIIYCLNLDCAANLIDCEEAYKTLIRTAQISPGANAFEAELFTGAMDAAANALDGGGLPNGGHDGVAQGKPDMPDDQGTIGSGNEDEDKPDNYLWNYTVLNQMDLISPYIMQVYPGLDQGSIPRGDNIEINFSKRMRSYTLPNMSVDEYPSTNQDDEEMGFGILVRDVLEDNKTLAILDPTHDFGPNGEDHFYFPRIPSDLVDKNMNCLYPGLGPTRSASSEDYSPICSVGQFDENSNPVPASITNCVGVSGTDPEKDTGCMDIQDPGAQTTSDVQACIDHLENVSVQTEVTPSLL